MKVNLEYSTEYNKFIQHEKAIQSFFKQNNINKQYIQYDNFKQYANAKHFVKWQHTTTKDAKTFNKFIRHWITTKGNVKTSWLTKINKMLKYYTQKEQNYKHKLLRVTLRPNSIKQ